MDEAAMTERNSVPPATERAGVVERLDGADGGDRTRIGKPEGFPKATT